MITLAGTITHKLEQSLVVETGGIGYQLWVTPADLEQAQTGQAAQLWVYEYIREDARDLYGFLTRQQRELFTKLIGVSGVGPKAALSILSVGSWSDVSQAISNGDIALLQSAPGIGKRTAERISIELKTDVETGAVDSSQSPGVDTAQEALQSLGYSQAAAAQALAGVPRDLSEEERIKRALREVGT